MRYCLLVIIVVFSFCSVGCNSDNISGDNGISEIVDIAVNGDINSQPDNIDEPDSIEKNDKIEENKPEDITDQTNNESAVEEDPVSDSDYAAAVNEYHSWRRKLSRDYYIKDGNIFYIEELIDPEYDRNKIFESYTNVDGIYGNRFIRFSDGTWIDAALLYSGSDNYRAKLPTMDIIRDLEATCGVKEIYDGLHGTVEIYANDGTLYTIEELALLLNGIEKVEISTYSKTEKCMDFIRVDKDLYEVVLTSEGSVYCEIYPELSEWKNIIDVRRIGMAVYGLTSDGKLLSVGDDITYDNIVQMLVMNSYGESFLICLTEDGNLIFPTHYPQECESFVREAEALEDLVYFIPNDYILSEPPGILAIKSDGSLVATTNNKYNPEYVTMP